MVYRFAIANVPADVIASRGQSAKLAGSVSAGFGFGDWGIEPSVFVEFAPRDAQEADRVLEFVVSILREFGESAAYFTVNGASPALLWHSAGARRVENLTPDRFAPDAALGTGVGFWRD